jgi:hypothetical protein
MTAEAGAAREPRALEGADAGIARIFSADGRHRGMGILVSPRLVLTCAHVVNLATGRAIGDPDGPSGQAEVVIDFPLSASGGMLAATVARFAAPDRAGRSAIGDLALLRLTADAPRDAGRAILADVADLTEPDRGLKVFGFPGEDAAGRWARALVAERSNPAWIQIDGAAEGGVAIEPGFSGAAVHSPEDDAVVGMVVSRLRAGDRAVAFMIPSAAIIAFAPEVPHESRTLPSGFSRHWSLAFIATFVVALSHFLADRIQEFPAWLSLGFGNKQLSSFYGMHLCAIAPVYLFHRMRRFAVSRREHVWWRRVPRLSLRSPGIAPASASAAGAVAILLMAGALLYMQGHFVKRFFAEGHVYVYGDVFGYTRAEMLSLAPGIRCEVGGSTLCTHPHARRFGVVAPKPGAPGGYLDNVYHYGDVTARVPRTQTFFPILQPAIVLALTALVAVLAAAAWIVIIGRAAGDRPS